MGTFFAGYGLAQSLGLVFGYLLMSPEPATLDDIAEHLGISKSGASTTARTLSTFGMVRRVSERGSRRIRYEPIPAMDGLLTSGVAQLQIFVQTLDDGRRVAPPGAPVARLDELLTGIQFYMDAIQEALRRLKEVPRP